MNPSKVQTELQEYSRKCIVELDNFKSNFERAVHDFLTSNRKNCLLVETRDSKLGAIRTMHLLEQLKEDQENKKALDRYLGAENQTFLHWRQLLDTVGTATDLPRFTNLLVCMFPDHESWKIENIEEELFYKISDRLNIAVLKKIIFITSHKGELNQYLKEINTEVFLKIDEFENKVTSLIDDGETALLDKASCGDVNGVEQLLKNGIDVNATSGEDQLTALHVAAEKGHKNVVLTLLRNGADILPNKSGDNPLHAAAVNGHTDVVRVLLENDVDAEVEGAWRQTALAVAAANGHREVIKTLLKYNANINGRNENNDLVRPDKPLHAAVLNERKGIVLMLLENGAETDVKGYYGQTALHTAAESYNIDMVKIILEHGSNIHAQNYVGRTPLHIAVLKKKKDIEVIRTLLNYGADINASDMYQRTALNYAVLYSPIEIIKFLLEQGANVQDKDEKGKTVLDLALERGDDSIISLLKAK